MTRLPAPPADTKDWTWVIERRCGDCGFDPAEFGRTDFADRIDGAVRFWRDRLTEQDIRNRPEPLVWSPLEYAGHVRDVFEVFDRRYRQMLAAGDGVPVRFANWDQDEAARAGDYAAQDPDLVAAAIGRGADQVAGLLRSIDGHAWDRTGLRGDGSSFTVETLSTYLLHDLVHHEWDVTAGR